MGCSQGSGATGLSWLLLCASCEVRYSVLLAVEELLLLRRASASSSGAHLLLFRQGYSGQIGVCKLKHLWCITVLDMYFKKPQLTTGTKL